MPDAQDLGNTLLEHRNINRQRKSSLAVGNDDFYALSTYRGHAVLGRADVQKGEIQAAEMHLSKMIELHPKNECDFEDMSSLILDEDFQLAHELLEAGAAKVVIKFAESCRDSWALGKDAHAKIRKKAMQEWLAQIHKQFP